MNTCVLLVSLHAFAAAITVKKYDFTQDIVTKKQIELKPYEIPCALNDILIISAPIVHANETRYYLYDPTGASTELNLAAPSELRKMRPGKYIIEEYDTISIHFFKDVVPIFTPSRMYDKCAINQSRSAKEDLFDQYVKGMRSNEFMLGPLLEENYGNWMISIYYQDNQGEWIEVFQVFTVEITEIVPAKESLVYLEEGADFHPMFAYGINNVTSCQLIVPKTAVDHAFDRQRLQMDHCGFTVQNVTTNDEGTWQIVGVGRIIYKTLIELKIKDKNNQTRLAS